MTQSLAFAGSSGGEGKMILMLAVIALMALAFWLQFARLAHEAREAERAYRDEFIGAGEGWLHPLGNVKKSEPDSVNWDGVTPNDRIWWEDAG
jgi:hypothetical protein